MLAGGRLFLLHGVLHPAIVTHATTNKTNEDLMVSPLIKAAGAATKWFKRFEFGF